METIKISVEVNVNLSENTQKFLTSLFGNAIAPSAPVALASKPTPQPMPAKSAPAKPTPQPAAPAQTQSAAKPAPSAPAAPAASSASKTIEDVRGMLAKKVNEHRDVIKQKLNELGAPSVTKLDPTKYDEMYNFLSEL